LFGEHTNVTGGIVLGGHPLDLGQVEGEVGGPPPDDDLGPGHRRDLAVHEVGGREQRRPPAVAAVGEAHRLEHLVRPVRREDLRRLDPVGGGDGLPQRGGGAVGVAVPLIAESSAARASANAGGGGTGASLVLRRTATSTCGEW
jgi:hypothetical protein